MIRPFVSCFCITYGQPEALEESIYSFLNQDYGGPKELVIINDCPYQTLKFDHESVRIVNVNSRIALHGKKLNLAVAHCDGDVLFRWDDRSIYLNNRISYSIDHLENGVFYTISGVSVIRDGEYNMYCESSQDIPTYAMTKEVFREIGGYTEDNHALYDYNMTQKLIEKSQNQDVPREKTFFIYRYSTVEPPHTILPIDLSDKQTESLIAMGQLKSGVVDLDPKWHFEYDKIDLSSVQSEIDFSELPETRDPPLTEPVRQTGKIAFCFSAYGEINHEAAWAEFFSQAGPDQLSVHIHQSNLAKLEYLQKQVIDDRIRRALYGGIGVLNMHLLLLEHALRDPNNDKFVLVSNSCIPLKPWDYVYEHLMADQYSHLNKADRRQLRPRCNHLYGRVTYPELHKCANWIVLSRRHAEACVRHDELRLILNDVWVPEEIYFLSTLMKHDYQDIRLTRDTDPSRHTTFTNWQGINYPFASECALKNYSDVSSKELAFLRLEPCLFGRKFNTECVVDGVEPLTKNIIEWLRRNSKNVIQATGPSSQPYDLL
jgi:hypothetical protein